MRMHQLRDSGDSMRVGEKSVTSEFLLRDIITHYFFSNISYFSLLMSLVMIISCHSMSLPVAETRGGGEDVVLGEQEAAARGPVPACHRHRHQPGPAPITARHHQPPPITAHLAPCVPAAASSVARASSGRARGSMSCDGAGLCDTSA